MCDWGPGDVQVFESISDMPARDPDMAFSPAQYAGIVDGIKDGDAKALAKDALDREDWTALNDMIADSRLFEGPEMPELHHLIALEETIAAMM